MIAAVSRESDVVDHLAGYLNRAKRAPTFVSGRPAQARKSNAPGDEVPGENGKVAASSSRPGKRTNDTVAYGRIGFQDFPLSAANPADALPGDVILINRTTGGRGHDTNRITKSATIRQINAVLDAQQRERYNTISNPASNSMLNKMLEVRESEFDKWTDRVKHMQRELDETVKRCPGAVMPITDMRERLAKAEKWRDYLEELKDECAAPTVAGNTCLRFEPFVDWRAVDLLRDWKPDGVLLNKDDDERNADWFAAGGGDSGTVFNVAVQGPAMLRNRASAFEDAGESRIPGMPGTPPEDEQLVDASIQALDEVMLLLVCEPVMEAPPLKKVKAFKFSYKLCSGRILLRLSEAVANRGGANASTDHAPGSRFSESDAALTVAVWRLGKVLDAKLVTGKHAAARLNVAISEMDMLHARDEHAFKGGLGVAHSSVGKMYFIDAV
tara:strand:- start:91 stop:1416 length:1326 start_codon:yes stop_codon:yes gene_type:complete